MPAVGTPAASSRSGSSAWLLLAGAFAAFTVSAGLMHSYAVFLVAFIQAFAWSRAETSIAYSVSQLVAGASSPLVGAMVDRLGPLRLLLIGSVLLIAGLIGCAHVMSLWQIILLYGVVMTFGANCLGLVVFVPILSRRFVRRRGMAISVVQSANGFARAVSAPVVQLLISSFGWRETFLLQAGFMGVMVVPLAAMFRRGQHAPPRRPEPGGAPPAVGNEPMTAAFTRLDPERGRAHAAFLAAVCGLSFHRARQFSGVIASARLSPSTAALTSSMPPGCWAWGAFSPSPARSPPDRYPTISVARGQRFSPMACRSSGSSARCLLPTRIRAGCLWLFACFFGLTWGARGPAITAKTADLFPGRQLGTILGVITIGSGIGSAVGSWAAGWIFDLSGSYELAFILSIISYACGCIAFWALRRPPARRAVQGPFDQAIPP